MSDGQFKSIVKMTASYPKMIRRSFSVIFEVFLEVSVYFLPSRLRVQIYLQGKQVFLYALTSV